MREECALEIWTVYARPKDDPANYVARLFLVTGGTTITTNETIRSPELAEIRKAMQEKGLTRLMRQTEDDPVIVENWL